MHHYRHCNSTLIKTTQISFLSPHIYYYREVLSWILLRLDSITCTKHTSFNQHTCRHVWAHGHEIIDFVCLAVRHGILLFMVLVSTLCKLVVAKGDNRTILIHSWNNNIILFTELNQELTIAWFLWRDDPLPDISAKSQWFMVTHNAYNVIAHSPWSWQVATVVVPVATRCWSWVS